MTDTSNRSRVSAGVPTGGEFAREQRAENADLTAPAQKRFIVEAMLFDKDSEMAEVVPEDKVDDAIANLKDGDWVQWTVSEVVGDDEPEWIGDFDDPIEAHDHAAKLNAEAASAPVVDFDSCAADDAKVEGLFSEAWASRLLDRSGGFSATVGRTANGDRVTVDFSMVKYRPEVIDARTGDYTESIWAINKRIGLIPKGSRSQAVIEGTPAEAARQFLPDDKDLAELGELFAGDDHSTGEHPFPLGMMVRGTPKQMEQDLELRKEVSEGRISYRRYLERRATEIPDDGDVKFGAERYYPPNPEAVARVFELLRKFRARRVA